MAEPNRIPMEEILASPKYSTILLKCLDALEAGGMFEFGVDKTDLGFRLTINLQVIGVYLHPDADVFRARIDSSYEAVIAPSQARAGSTEHSNGEEIAIYVLPDEFERFQQDAQFVYDLYCLDGMCFRGIPDVWFKDLPLVQFIRNHLAPQPVMSIWFERGSYGTGGLWLSHELNCPPWVQGE